MNRPARPVAEGALLAALGALFILISFYVPIIGTLATLVSPIPTAFMVIRHGPRWGVASSTVTLLVLIPFMSPIGAVALWAIYGAMGLALGYCVRREMSPEKTLLYMSGASLFGLVIDMAAAYLATGLTLGDLVEETRQMFLLAVETSSKMLGPNPVLDGFAATFTKEAIMRTLPAGAVLGAVFVAWMNYEVTRRLLPRFGHAMQPFRPFSRWIMPEIVAHGWIASMFLVRFQHLYAQALPALPIVVENVLLGLSLLVFVDALAALWYFSQNAQIPKPMGVFAIIMLISVCYSTPLIMLAAQLFGMIDMLFDLRHLRRIY